MGRRGKDEIERLEAEVRELKAINRSLLKQIKKLDRGYKEREEEGKGKKKPKDILDDKEESTSRSCPECHVGYEVERTVLDRRWLECTKCDRRTKAKIQSP
jgi:hypothetical protein